MTKVLRCSDMMPGCDYVARAETEDELMQKAAQEKNTACRRCRQRSSSRLRARYETNDSIVRAAQSPFIRHNCAAHSQRTRRCKPKWMTDDGSRRTSPSCP